MAVPLPPARIRRGGPELADDGIFLDSGKRIVDLLRHHSSLGAASRVVDFGCGPGRLAIALIESGWFAGTYVGVDVKAGHIDWCNEHIASTYPAYRFITVDAANQRYNPSGSSPRRIPVEPDTADVVCAWSVFSHMLGDDTFAYLCEIRRILAPGGRAYVTAFVADGVPDETENPPWFGESWSGRLHCVLYSIDRMSQLIADAGLTLDQRVELPDHEQIGLVLAKPVRPQRE